MSLITELAGAGRFHSRGRFTRGARPAEGDSWLVFVRDEVSVLGYRLGGIDGSPLQVLMADSGSCLQRGYQISQALAELRPMFPQVHLLWG